MKKVKKTKLKKKRRYATGEYISTKTGETYSFRSSWEKIFMESLDANPDVKTYGYECIVIPYIKNVKLGTVSRYFPDFLVTYNDGSKTLIEIKPSRFLKRLIVKKKIAAAEQWARDNNATFLIITEKELKSQGMLLPKSVKSSSNDDLEASKCVKVDDMNDSLSVALRRILSVVS